MDKKKIFLSEKEAVIEQTRKETAKEIFQTLYDKYDSDGFGLYEILKLAEKYGVEVEK